MSCQNPQAATFMKQCAPCVCAAAGCISWHLCIWGSAYTRWWCCSPGLHTRPGKPYFLSHPLTMQTALLNMACMCCVQVDLLVLCTVAAWTAALVHHGRTGQQASSHTLTSASFQDRLALLQVSCTQYPDCSSMLYFCWRSVLLCITNIC